MLGREDRRKHITTMDEQLNIDGYLSVAYIAMAYVVMVQIVLACMVMACVVIAHVVLALPWTSS